MTKPLKPTLTRRGRPRKVQTGDDGESMALTLSSRFGDVLPAHWQPPEECRDGRIYRKAVTSAWEIRPRVSTIQWFEGNVKVSARTSDFQGAYSRHNFPYQRGVLDAFDDMDVRQISLQWATQMGKSFLIQNLVSKIAACDPSPMMFACPDSDTAKEISVERIMPAVEKIPELRAKLLPEARRDAYKPDLGDCVVFMAWSGSPSTLGQRSCRYVFCTELSKWSRDKSDEADPSDLVRERVKAFWDSKIILEGTPTIDGICRIEYLGNTANQRFKFHIPCPKCKTYQWMYFQPRGGVGGVKWTKLNEKNDRDLAEVTAYYECQHCKHEISDMERVTALRVGIWAEDGAQIPEGYDKSIFWTEGKAKRRVHFDLSSLYSPVQSIGTVAAEFVRCMQGEGLKKLQNFVNSWLAETWKQNIKEYDWKSLRILCADTPSGEVPPWAVFLTAGIDPGTHADTLVIRAWGEGGRSRLVAWNRINHPPDKLAFKEFEAYIFHCQYGVQSLPVSLCGIDSGYKSYEVYIWTKEMNEKYGERCRAIKGLSKGAPYWASKQERSGENGTVIQGGITLWLINDHYWKEYLTGKFDTPVGHPGAFEIPCDASELYLRSICSEVLQEKTDARGHVRYEWVVIDKVAGNHFMDCEKIAAVMADMLDVRAIESTEVDMTPGPPAVFQEKPDDYLVGSGEDYWS